MTFKELCNSKIHVAVTAMVEGLREQDQYSFGEVEMRTYGIWCDKLNKSYCNAATCAIQHLIRYPFDNYVDSYTAKVTLAVAENNDYCRFEYAIDALSAGVIHPLISYFGTNVNISFSVPPLTNHTWKTNLKHYEKLRDYYKNKNL